MAEIRRTNPVVWFVAWTQGACECRVPSLAQSACADGLNDWVGLCGQLLGDLHRMIGIHRT